MKTKKITIISSYFAPAWAYGGPPKVLFTLAKALTKFGITVNVITTDSLGEERSAKLEETIDGIKIYRLPTLSNTLAYKLNFFYAPQIPGKIDEILQKSDTVLFSDTRSVFNWQFYLHVKHKKIPYGVFAFGQIPWGLGVRSVIKKIFDLMWVTHFIRSASFRFAQTEHERDMYQKYFGVPKDKTKLLPLPVESVDTKPDENEVERFRKKWQIGINDKVIIFVGRIHYLKGVDILIKSIKDVLKTDKHVKLLIVGRDDGYLGKLMDIISEDIKKQIIFTGALYGEDAKAAYLASSCFCITPRFYEETSTAALEALAQGIPVINTPEADIPLLQEYDAGRTVDNDPHQILKALTEIIISNNTQKINMRKNAIKLIKEKYNSLLIAKKLLHYLENSDVRKSLS